MQNKTTSHRRALPSDEQPCCTTLCINNVPVLIICTTKIYHTKTLLAHKITNLLTHDSYHRRWLDNPPSNIEPGAKLLAVAGTAHNVIKLSCNVSDTGKHLLVQHWRSTPQQREIMLTETQQKLSWVSHPKNAQLS